MIVMMGRIAYLKSRYLPLTEIYIYWQIKYLRRYEPIVICAKKMNLDKFPIENIRSFSDRKISYLVNGLSLKLFNYSPYYSRVIEEEDISLIHAVFGGGGVRALPYKKKFGLPLITDFHGNDASALPRKKPGIYKEIINVGDLFLVRSNDMKRDLISLGFPEEKILVHYLGIPIDQYEFKKRELDKELNILLVARFIEKKGIPYAIKALKKVVKVYDNVKLKIIGDGPLRSEIESLIHNLNLERNIILLGKLPKYSDVIREMLNAHIFILPSVMASDGDKEGTPTVLIEAQATGLPVISTHHAGIPEIVIDGKTGFLAKERNVDELAKKIMIFIENPDLIPEFGHNARKHTEERFNIHKQDRMLERVYDKLIQSS